MQPFAEWAPDAYALGADVASEASGVVPKGNSYGPLPQPAQTSLAVPAAVRGAFAARTTTNAIAIFAFTAARAYKFAGVSAAWTNVSRASAVDYALAADDYWSTRQFGTVLIATEIADVVQSIDVTSGTNFAALGGSPPQAKFVEVAGDFVVLGNTTTSGRQIRNSARNDAAGWTAGQKDSDGQTFNDGGDVQGMAGYEVGGLVFQSETMRRLSLRQDAAIYETHKVDPARGTASPHSIVKDGGDVYYYSNTGFLKLGGDGGIGNIGTDRVNEWFRSNINQSRQKAIIGALDPIVRRIYWLCPSASNASSTTLDLLLIYDIERNRFTHFNSCALTYIFPAATPGYTLAALAAIYTTLTAVPYPFGSDVWKGGAPGLAAFDSANKLCFFTGTPCAASVQTAPFEAIPGKRAFIQGFRLYGDAVNATGKVGGSERPQTAVTMPGGSQTVNAQGRIPARISTRIAQIQVDIAAGESWTHLAGVDFDGDDISDDGER